MQALGSRLGQAVGQQLGEHLLVHIMVEIGFQSDIDSGGKKAYLRAFGRDEIGQTQIGRLPLLLPQ